MEVLIEYNAALGYRLFMGIITEIKGIIISIAVPLVAVFISYLGSCRGTKGVKEDLESRRRR